MRYVPLRFPHAHYMIPPVLFFMYELQYLVSIFSFLSLSLSLFLSFSLLDLCASPLRVLRAGWRTGSLRLSPNRDRYLSNLCIVFDIYCYSCSARSAF